MCKRAGPSHTVQLKISWALVMHIFWGRKILTFTDFMTQTEVTLHFKGGFYTHFHYKKAWRQKLRVDIVSTIFQSELMTQLFFWYTNPLCAVRSWWLYSAQRAKSRYEIEFPPKLDCSGCLIVSIIKNLSPILFFDHPIKPALLI